MYCFCFWDKIVTASFNWASLSFKVVTSPDKLSISSCCLARQLVGQRNSASLAVSYWYCSTVMRFIDPNSDTDIVHKTLMRVNEIHSPVLFRFESTTGLGHINIHHPLPIPLNPKPSGQCFNRRPLMRFMRVNMP